MNASAVPQPEGQLEVVVDQEAPAAWFGPGWRHISEFLSRKKRSDGRDERRVKIAGIAMREVWWCLEPGVSQSGG